MDRPPSKRGRQPDPNSAKSIRLAKRKTTAGQGRRRADSAVALIPFESFNGYMARWSPYSEDIGNIILHRIAAGDTLKAICEPACMPNIETISHWRVINPSFSMAYVRARQASAHRKAEEIEEIADDPSVASSHEAVGHARLRIDARKWAVSKLLPQVYGDKLDVTADLQLTVNIKRFTPVVDAIDVQPFDSTDDPGKVG